MKVVSVFSGIGGFDLAAEQAGMEVVACIERDPHCRKLLAARFPKAQIFDDVCTVGAHNLPACDIVCGGWPCQDLSVAGKRAGIVDGERSNLFYELTRLIRELRPRYFLAENVPGLFSSDGGGDFARVLGELAKCGKADIAWRTLDSQWFGVAQRRRRVFIVADFGGERASEILSLAESLRRNTPPSREAGKEIAGTLGGSSQSGGCREVAHAVCSHAAKGGDPTTDNYVTTHNNTGQGWWNESEVAATVRTPCGGDSTMSTVVAFKPSHYTRDKDGAPSEVYPPLSADADKGDQEAVVFQPRYYTRDNKTGGAPSDKADITNCAKAGDSAPHVVVPIDLRATSRGAKMTNNRDPEKCSGGPAGTGIGEAGDPAFTVSERQQAVAYRTAGNCGPFEQGDKTGALNTATDPNQNIVVLPGMEMEIGEADLYNALKAGDGGSSRQQTVLIPSSAVRRLLPVECERLQNFPDGWTAGFADSVRYRMLGNAVTVATVRWILARIAALT